MPPGPVCLLVSYRPLARISQTRARAAATVQRPRRKTYGGEEIQNRAILQAVALATRKKARGLHCAIGGLDPSTDYEVKVWALNTFGASPSPGTSFKTSPSEVEVTGVKRRRELGHSISIDNGS